MGAGRKKQTFVMQEKALPPWTSNGSVTSRNLGKSKLAGVIFGCKHNTMQECLSKQLFGLLSSSFADQPYVFKQSSVIIIIFFFLSFPL